MRFFTVKRLQLNLGKIKYCWVLRVSSRDFVYAKFCEYYRDQSTQIPSPGSVDQREFAYLMFKERFMVRHKRFDKINNLKAVLSEIAPSDVYHSCAYYENPDFDMDKKGWLGSDLVFDIDADHIPVSYTHLTLPTIYSV